MLRILGIDPGLSRTGWGLVEANETGISLLHSGVITSSSRLAFPRRLVKIYDGLQQLIDQHAPEVVAVEDVIFAENVRVALKLGQARGVILLLAAKKGLPVAEYLPREIKQSLTGNGNASKVQMQRMVQSILRLQTLPSPHDVADAIAVALCHFHRCGSKTAVEGR